MFQTWQQPRCPQAVGSRQWEEDICFGSKHPPGNLGENKSYRGKWGWWNMAFPYRKSRGGSVTLRVGFSRRQSFFISAQFYSHLRLPAAALEFPSTASVYDSLNYIRPDPSRLDLKDGQNPTVFCLHVWEQNLAHFQPSPPQCPWREETPSSVLVGNVASAQRTKSHSSHSAQSKLKTTAWKRLGSVKEILKK